MNVRDVFDYDAAAGRLVRRTLDARSKPVTTAVTVGGYPKRWFNGRMWAEHRLIWLWHYGAVPPELDHKDRDRMNCRIENLRPATRSQNAFNRVSRSATGVKGVAYVPRLRHKPYVASIGYRGKTINLGSFAALDEAAAAYAAAAATFAGVYACTDRKVSGSRGAP